MSRFTRLYGPIGWAAIGIAMLLVVLLPQFLSDFGRVYSGA
jgi:hypothetical protein